MEYLTYDPHPELESLINQYWSLKVPEQEKSRQRIIPDGCIEMAFILGDDIKRYTSEDDYILQPRAMVLGQVMDPFYIEPVGEVDTFAISFFPLGFSNLISKSLDELVNTETPLDQLFDPMIIRELENNVIHADSTQERIKIVEAFLFERLQESRVIDQVIRTTVEVWSVVNKGLMVPIEVSQLGRNLIRIIWAIIRFFRRLRLYFIALVCYTATT